MIGGRVAGACVSEIGIYLTNESAADTQWREGEVTSELPEPTHQKETSHPGSALLGNPRYCYRNTHFLFIAALQWEVNMSASAYTQLLDIPVFSLVAIQGARRARAQQRNANVL